MKLKLLFTCILVAFLSTSSLAQTSFKDNGLTAGLRMGANYSSWFGFSLRLNTESGSGELILTPENDRIVLTGLLCFQDEVGGSLKRLSYYYGLGAHVGIQSNAVPVIGADAIAGVEYDIPNLPLFVSIDMKPALDLFGSEFGFHWNQGAITLRYTIGR